MEQEKQLTSLPENAYRELKPGEEYTPIMPASSSPREVTPYSVTMGIVMAVVFSAAAAFLGLKVGQVFEAAIPIAIIAVGMGNVLGKKNMLGQNVIIQSIGACSGVIVAGAIFTLPALYILGLDAAFYQVFLSSLFGGLLGIVLLIPFRKYFVKEMHGKYPFPEATATTEVLISGEKGGNQAKLLAVAGLIGGLYDFAVGTFGMWTEAVSTRICAWGQVAADKFKVVFSLNTSAAVLGLGYIIGLKYAMIITAGSCLVWFLVVPLVGSLADSIDPAAMASLLGVTRADIMADPQRLFTAENLFAFIGKPLGIGGIAMAGIIGIVKQSKIIRQAVGLAVSELGGGNKTQAAATERTQRDLTMKRILTILIATLVSIFVFFHFGLLDGWVQSVTAILIVFVISFLFTTVAANAIAIVGTNPVSGMTLMTLILSSLVLVSVGLSGTTGMTAALIIGGVVFGCFAGMTYWWPKAFGFKLNETWGKRAFWFWIIGFFVAFMPLYALGFMGMTRRLSQQIDPQFHTMLMIAASGAVLIALGILCLVIQMYVSIRDRDQNRDLTGDPWGGRTLEWATSSPPPFYNFAVVPHVHERDAFWEMKEKGEAYKKPDHYEEIHMPKNSGAGIVIAAFSTIFGFAMIWHIWWLAIVGFAGMIITWIVKSFDEDVDYYVPVAEIEKLENQHFDEITKAGLKNGN